MSTELETFVLYYTAWHEGEYTLAQMKAEILNEIQLDGLHKALAEFKVENQKRWVLGDRRTYYQANR